MDMLGYEWEIKVEYYVQKYANRKGVKTVFICCGESDWLSHVAHLRVAC